MKPIYKQEYITDKSFEEAVNELPITDEKSRKALKKKLKGRKYDSDKKILMEIGGLPEKDAGDYAYMLSEVANWNDFWNMLNLNGKTSAKDTQHIIDYINSAVTVETTPKVSLKVIEQ